MNVKDAEQLIREISETNNINDLSFVWPKESIPSALPLGDSEGATRDLNRLLDLLAIVKPVHGAKKPMDYKHMIRLIELYDLVPKEVINKLKSRLSEVFDDNDLISQPELSNRRENPVSYKDKLNPDSDKFKEALANFNNPAPSNRAHCRGPKPCNGSLIGFGELRLGVDVKFHERYSYHSSMSKSPSVYLVSLLSAMIQQIDNC
ncbi:hypothetical protein E3Q23_02680 [Wallemia mellicola]|nr:hypothetical protein E3Q23_02680 [Wallemia mellicola]TIC04293.1 hypothetical protein E3Q16_02782 [Wallemia mellicola]